jgi:20S proteasome alpha/beta subunit
MNKDEALKMAIEALEHASERSIIINAYEEVIDACKEALEADPRQNVQGYINPEGYRKEKNT